MAIGPLGNVASPKLQFFLPGTNTPLAGGLLFTYAAGTTTKQATYANDAQTPNTNPIILDANGQCVCFVDSTLKYDFTLSPSTDTDPPTNPYWTVGSMGYQEMIASFAPINSPVFTGNPEAPTPTLGDSSSAIATTQFVQETITDSALFATPTFVNDAVAGAYHHQVFYGSGSFTVPPLVAQVKARCWAAGGGGGAGLASAAAGSGGGGGGYAESVLQVTPASSLTITVGNGGAGSSSSSNGTTGGASSVTGQSSGTCSATGGAGGVSSSSGAATPGGVGGSGSGSLAVTGGQGAAATVVSPNGWGASGGGAFSSYPSGFTIAGSGITGAFPAAGGGGGSNTNNGGAGANGLVILEWLQP